VGVGALQTGGVETGNGVNTGLEKNEDDLHTEKKPSRKRKMYQVGRAKRSAKKDLELSSCVINGKEKNHT